MLSLGFRIRLLFLLCACGFVALGGNVVFNLVMHNVWQNLDDTCLMLAHDWEEAPAAVRMRLPSAALPFVVTVTDDGGQVIDSTESAPPSLQGRPEIAAALGGQVGHSVPYADSLRAPMLYAAAPLYERSGALVGALRVGLSSQVVGRSLEPLRRLLVTTLLGMVALALALAHWLTRSLSRPLQRLSDAVLDATPAPEDGPLEMGRLARALNETRNAQREFIAHASHELRTPVGALAAALETLERGAKDDPAARDEFIRRARREASRLQRLANDLLELTAAEAVPQDDAQAQCDVAVVCTEQAEAFVAAAEERGQTLQLQVPREAVPVAVRADHAARVIGNVLDNAIKYGREGGTIRLGVAGREVTVDDDGPGMPADERERVFERFYRLDKARSRAAGGAGLGLAIARHLVERAGGTIVAEAAPSGGTRIRITWPAITPAAAQTGAPRPSPAATTR